MSVRGRHAARLVAAATTAAIAAGSAAAEPPGGDPDWPCVQRLVPELTSGTYWAGPAPKPGADWRADPKIADLVAALASRDLPVDEGAAKLAAFADSLPPDQRRTVLPELFAGLVDAINGQRHEVIVRLKELSRRQKSIAALVEKVEVELRGASTDATRADADSRNEVEQRRGFLIRTFQETQRTIQYACQVPTELEARLGRYARTLEARL